MRMKLWSSCGLMTPTLTGCLRHFSIQQAARIVIAHNLKISWLLWWATWWRWSAGSRRRARGRLPRFKRPTLSIQPLETLWMVSNSAHSRRTRWQTCLSSSVLSKLCPSTTSSSWYSTSCTWRLRIWQCRTTLKTWRPCYKLTVLQCLSSLMPPTFKRKSTHPKRQVGHLSRQG